MLTVTDLDVSYGAIAALGGISFKIEPGAIVTLIGGNGAGKTTTLRTISGLLRAQDRQHQVPGRGHHQAARRTRSSPAASATCPRAG